MIRMATKVVMVTAVLGLCGCALFSGLEADPQQTANLMEELGFKNTTVLVSAKDGETVMHVTGGGPVTSASAGQTRMNPPSAMEKWQLASRSLAERQKDWIECGGALGGEYATISGDMGAAATRLSGEEFDHIQRCMMVKGYRYIGTCEGESESQYFVCLQRAGAAPYK